jgi:hypothetical protein
MVAACQAVVVVVVDWVCATGSAEHGDRTSDDSD